MDVTHHYGVVVGIDHYLGISNLKFARRDALAFHDWLTKAGLESENLQLVCLPDSATPAASLEEAEPALRKIWFALRDKLLKVREAVKNDPTIWSQTRLYFFFSGHGVAPQALDAIGLSAEATLDGIGYGASLKRLTESLLESGDFAELVMVADCCRNKPVGRFELGGPPWSAVYSKRSEEPSVATLYATIYGDPAREPTGRDPDKERGYYTRALIEGLGGAPQAVRPDGSVTTQSLHSYARQRVIELTEGKQKPPKSCGADLVLAENVDRKDPRARPVRVQFARPLAGTAVMQDGAYVTLGTRAVGAQDWTTLLSPGLYRIVVDGDPLPNDGVFSVTDEVGELVVRF